MDWKIIVQIAILLQCIGLLQDEVDVPFLECCRVSMVSCVTIPAEYITLDDAHTFISNYVANLAAEAVLNVTPQYAEFPYYMDF